MGRDDIDREMGFISHVTNEDALCQRILEQTTGMCYGDRWKGGFERRGQRCLEHEGTRFIVISGFHHHEMCSKQTCRSLISRLIGTHQT
jgi:hypothetical protein